MTDKTIDFTKDLQSNGFVDRQALNPDLNKSVCLYPFVQLSTMPSGFIRPCCYYLNDHLLDDDGERATIERSDLAKVWNGNHLKSIRKGMAEGRLISGCVQCHREEAAGKTSMRHRSFEQWGNRSDVMSAVEASSRKDFEMDRAPYFLELKPGNLCNLKCRMCNQYDSSQIAKELRQLATQYPEIDVRYQSRLGEDPWPPGTDLYVENMPDWENATDFWRQIETWLPFVETLSFAGGEPTLLESVHRILNRCIETGQSEKMSIFLASNFTNVRQKLIDIAPRFKKFEFIASIDGFGPIQEYIRHPSKWQAVSENFNRVKAHQDGKVVKVLANVTIQMNNILHFTDLLRWIDEQDLAPPEFWQWPYALNVLFYPRYLCIEFLPPSLRPIAMQRISHYMSTSHILKRWPLMRERLEFILSMLEKPLPDDYEYHQRKFREVTGMLDKHRGESLATVDPDLFRAFFAHPGAAQ